MADQTKIAATTPANSVPRPDPDLAGELAARRARLEELARARKLGECVAEPVEAQSLRAAAREVDEASALLGAEEARAAGGDYGARRRVEGAEERRAAALRSHEDALRALLGRLYSVRHSRVAAEECLGHVLALVGVLAEELAALHEDTVEVGGPLPVDDARIDELVKRARRLASCRTSSEALDAEGLNP
jgi:hypothetical protein